MPSDGELEYTLLIRSKVAQSMQKQIWVVWSTIRPQFAAFRLGSWTLLIVH